jgi:DNA replication protein DnaC
MNSTATLEQLRQLHLHGMAGAYQGIMSLPFNQHPEAHELLALLAEAETQHRSLERTKLYLKLSKLRFSARLDQVTCGSERNLEKRQLAALTDCTFIDRAENILITGATGCGKSYIACAIGNQACLMGHKAHYFNLNRFVERITLSRLEGTFVKMLNQLDKFHLLIIDDFGLAPLDQSTRLALLQLLEDRYAKRSTIIASQLPVSKWHEYLADPTLADAIMDRITTNSQRIELKGPSLRNKKSKENL